MKVTRFSVFVALAILFISRPALCQLTTTQVSYFNSGSSYYQLPGTYGVTSGTDTARTIVAYSERFTCPFAATYLDSVSVFMTVDSLGPSAAIAVEVFPSYLSGSLSFVNFVASPFGENVLLPTDPVYQRDSTKLYSFAMNHCAIPDTDLDFFVSLAVNDPAHTKALLWSDSTTSSTALPLNEGRDRSRLLLDKPYGGYYQYYMAGTKRDSSNLLWYPNFIMIAYASTPSGSVVELYPAAQDLLSFYVERMQTGTTLLHFSPKSTEPVLLELFDVNGRAISTLFDGVANPEDNTCAMPTGLASGMYFARLSSAKAVETRKIVVDR